MTDTGAGKMDFAPSGFLRRALSGSRKWQAHLGNTELVVESSAARRTIPYATITEATVGQGLISHSVIVSTNDETFHLGGLDRGSAATLLNLVRGGVQDAIECELESLRPAMDTLARVATAFLARDRYLAASAFAVWSEAALSPAAATIQRMGHLLHHSCVDMNRVLPRDVEAQELLDSLLRDPAGVVGRRNHRFVTNELTRLKDFFDTIESRPLTEEQRDAAVVLEDRNLLVAAAGSGKSSTVVAKVAYLIETGVCAPGEILVLAFNRSVRGELQERLARRVNHGEAVAVRTFHALGLEIIGNATGQRPDVPSWASDEGAGARVLGDIVNDLRAADVSFDQDWILFYALYGAPDVELTEFPNELAYRQYIRRIGELTRDQCGIRTLNGELVKSMQEAAIANWLFVNGIDYRYEDSYIHPTATSQRRQYHPDFYYPDIDVWHEHFALDRFGNGPPMWPGYVAEVTWKQHLHAQQGTKLIETTSVMFRGGALFSWLEAQLRKQGAVFNRRSRAEIDQRLRELRVSMRADFLQTFIRHWKSNRLDAASIRSRSSTEAHRSRADAFLRIAEPVFDAYNRRLAAAGGIDFEDMVNVAADHVEAGRYASPYPVILVDEFQDISSSRARLVRALLDQRPDSRLFAVGDDWQSIYRFAGSDAQLMMDFANRFGGATATRFLTKTFRSNQGICDAAAHFIQANPAQLKKTVEADDQRRDGVVRIVLHDGEKSMDRGLHDQLEVLASTARRGGRRVSVFVLGRYRHLEPTGLRAWRASIKDAVDVQFLTCHRAKGLEADYVFVLGCDSGDYGFPSEQEDDGLLKLVMPQSGAFPFAEERRLLYVAITRARHETWLFADKRKPSPFVSELTGSAYDGIVAVEATAAMTVEFCPQCSVGVVVPRTGPYGPFAGCSTFPVCDFTRSGGRYRRTPHR